MPIHFGHFTLVVLSNLNNLYHINSMATLSQLVRISGLSLKNSKCFNFASLFEMSITLLIFNVLTSNLASIYWTLVQTQNTLKGGRMMVTMATAPDQYTKVIFLMYFCQWLHHYELPIIYITLRWPYAAHRLITVIIRTILHFQGLLVRMKIHKIILK